MLGIDRERLWRKLFAFDHGADASSGAAGGVDALVAVVQEAVARGRQAPLRHMLVQRIGYWVRADVAPPFWRFFRDVAPLLATAPTQSVRQRRALSLYCAEQLTLALQLAEEAFAHCVQIASLFDSDSNGQDEMPGSDKKRRQGNAMSMLQELSLHFRCIMFEDFELAQLFDDILVIFFTMSFRKFSGKEKAQMFDAAPIRDILLQLEWMDVVADASLQRVIHTQARRMISSTCGDTFDDRFLHKVERWAYADLLPWLDELLQPTTVESSQKWQSLLSSLVLAEFGSLRMRQLFDIIKEFPESIPALEDLKVCLVKTEQHSELVRVFSEAVRSRLLQPGANTSEIIDVYVSTIKAFRIIDPKGVMLEALSGPVKEYLKQRKDTVRCIVHSLTDDQNGDLFEELHRSNVKLIEHDDDSDDDEDASPDSWEPDPIEADPNKTSQSRSSDDILRILVNIYGSRELFVNEYRLMLADKLLQNLEYDTDRDVQTLELLKLRFGEDSLQQCEIMVRDIEDSKRLNGNIETTLATGADGAVARQRVPVDATIVSEEFWPPFQKDTFALHPRVVSDIDAYQKAYSLLRNPRSLRWHASLGTVQLAIEVQGEEREFTVSPLQASIIMHFEDQDTWRVEALATALEISEDTLLKYASIWINHGVLIISADRHEMVAATSLSDSKRPFQGDDVIVDEMETAVSSDAQAAEDLKTLETYIVGMLANFGSLPIQRIHNMLSTFARSGAHPYDKTISGLAVILGKLVDKGKLELVAGQYQLVSQQ